MPLRKREKQRERERGRGATTATRGHAVMRREAVRSAARLGHPQLLADVSGPQVAGVLVAPELLGMRSLRRSAARQCQNSKLPLDRGPRRLLEILRRHLFRLVCRGLQSPASRGFQDSKVAIGTASSVF